MTYLKINCTTHVVIKNKLSGKVYKDEARKRCGYQ
jgi:hypothetical protein